MEKKSFSISGDSPDVKWSTAVYTFKGSDEKAPKAYLQGALHADELPGTAVLHFLCEALRNLEVKNQIVGDITIVPQANPIGTSQVSLGHLQGRFNLSDGKNFNRDFPLVSLEDREELVNFSNLDNAAKRMKQRLLYMALNADVVVDLHCDYESLLYAYMCEEFWPSGKDFAAAMNLHSVFLADGQSTAFEEAVAHAFRTDTSKIKQRVVTTLELRGQSDVDEKIAKYDAEGLVKFLAMRGVINAGTKSNRNWNGKATPLDHIEVIRSPVSGTILFDCKLGQLVQKGQVIAKIISKPGQCDGLVEVLAPQDGEIITRTFDRFATIGAQLYKMACDAPTTMKRTPGTLES